MAFNTEPVSQVNLPNNIDAEPAPKKKTDWFLFLISLIMVVLVIAVGIAFFGYNQQRGFVEHQQHVISKVVTERNADQKQIAELKSQLAQSKAQTAACLAQSDQFLKGLRDYTVMLSTWAQDILVQPDDSTVLADIKAGQSYTCVSDATAPTPTS